MQRGLAQGVTSHAPSFGGCDNDGAKRPKARALPIAVRDTGEFALSIGHFLLRWCDAGRGLKPVRISDDFPNAVKPFERHPD